MEETPKNKRKPISASPPIRKFTSPPGNWARSDKEKADLLAQHLQEVFTPHNNNQVQEVNSLLNEPIQKHQRPKLFTLKEMQETINTLKPKQAPGHDNITAVILKHLPRKGQIKLLYIFNDILRLDYWPRPLKITQIIMILKPGKKSNRRHILPTNKPSTHNFKSPRKTNTQQNKPRIKPKTWIPNHQFGFRRAHSTIQQSHRIANTITNALNDKQYCTVAFLDIAQAFDSLASWLTLQNKKNLPNKSLQPTQVIFQRKIIRSQNK
ncbi:hypothetical protein B7P43_G13441 [Cryptotermes secundus]|uniref:Reverse transcriptase domain-containing protein n=1 Tax=Cryptotermes secundus TaxID=105785 RepID=A0A2J7PFW8_9NEOP|nr:hypothetical protein B7P43_G13441 [Cryptotermes secundus]